MKFSPIVLLALSKKVFEHICTNTIQNQSTFLAVSPLYDFYIVPIDPVTSHHVLVDVPKLYHPCVYKGSPIDSQNNMNRDVFVEILSNFFISRANELELVYLVHQDNDPKHTSGCNNFELFVHLVKVLVC